METEQPGTEVLLIDDHTLFREAVARAMAGERDFNIVPCASIAEAMTILDRQSIDVVLLDYDLGFERGLRFLPAAKARGYSGPVLVVTAWVSDQEARRLLAQGVAGIFLKENPLSALAAAIRRVATGGAWLDQPYLKLALSDGDAEEPGSSKKLSDRERKILRCLLDGLSNKEIAARLQTSETSIKTALQRLFQKTGVRTRGQLIRIALEEYQDLL